MRPSVRGININAWAPKVDVDNRISLHFYYRIAENLLKQANVYREEKNLVDLYIILLRFSSLLCETIPSHRDYQSLLPKERSKFRKKLLDVINELELLKPDVQRQVDQMNREHMAKFDIQENPPHNFNASSDWQFAKKQLRQHSQNEQQGARLPSQSSWKYSYEQNQIVSSEPLSMDKPILKGSLTLPFPKEETLSRHSILGPSGLRGQWNGPITGVKVQYPKNDDLAKLETMSLYQADQFGQTEEKSLVSLRSDSTMESILSLDDGRWSHSSGKIALPVDAMPEDFLQLNIRQPSPPPVLAHVQPQQQEFHPIHPSLVADPRPGPAKISSEETSSSKTFQHLHIPVEMMECFLRLAEKNTSRNLETCGVLAGSLKNRMFCVTTLIIPKQEATSDSCQTTNEEEIFDYQDKRSLFPLGWIHTHPSQTCFMSSIDLHTHYSYQIMLPEAIAIVMAPTDESRTHGIFHLSDPGGVAVIRNCQQRGFHPHEEPADGSPLYEHCSHVYMNPNLQFEVADLR